MSDFSELCPLFSTGVYNELTLGAVTFTGISTTMNALAGTGTLAATPGSLKFDRTVIITRIYAQKLGAAGTQMGIIAFHHKATGTVAGTAFASILWTATDAKFTPNMIRKFTQASAKTFLAADVLGFSNKTGGTADPGTYGIIIRYKEK